MAQKTIKHVSFSYREEAEDPVRPGEKIVIERKAPRGATVEIPFEDDLIRGERHGAFVQEQATEDVDEVTSAREMTDEDLELWIREDKPTVQEVVDAAEGDPELARRLLDAEDKATDGNSRKGVLESLSAILGRGQ